MPRRRYLFDPPERFVAGTVGEPGDRTFFLQAREGPSRGLASSSRRSRSRSSPSASASSSTSSSGAASRRPRRSRRGRRSTTARPLDEPLNEAFRAGSLTLGWDGDAEQVLVEARAQSRGRRGDRPGRGRRRGRGRPRPAPRPDHRRRGRAIASSTRAARVVASGRPPCPLCGAAARPAGPHLPAPQRPLRQLAGRVPCSTARRRSTSCARARSRSSGGSSARRTTRCWSR